MAKAQTPTCGWWGETFLAYLQQCANLEPITPGQYKGALRGEATLEFSRGKVTADVGERWAAHTATLKVKPLAQRDWKRALDEIARRPDVAQRLLTGTPGAELQAALAAAEIELFPADAELRCKCHEYWECRHRRVLAVRGAAFLDADPFGWLEVLGMRREDLLAAVRARLADQAGLAARGDVGSLGLGLGGGLSPEHYLTAPGDPDAIAVRAGETATPDALLKVLGPLGLPPEVGSVGRAVVREVTRYGRTFQEHAVVQDPLEDVLARYLEQISRVATGLATGEIGPRFAVEESLPGKKVLPKTRLPQEIAEVVLSSDGPVLIDDLVEACPTASALGTYDAVTALSGALERLPEAFTVLAGRAVALREQALAGVTFRHTINLAEWRRRRLSADADWVRGLFVAGFSPPYEVQVGGEICRLPAEAGADPLFAQLAPEVGDHLVLTVADPARPLLVATLRRRAPGTDAGLWETDQIASAVLVREMEAQRIYELPERHCVEVLLAEGFYRHGRVSDPVWLLAAPVPNRPLDWGTGRALRRRGWYYGSHDPSFGQRPRGAWIGLQNAISRFYAALKEEGQTHRDAANAMDCVEAWSKRWPGNQTDLVNPPSVGVFADFLWNAAPAEAAKKKGLLAFPRALGAWFRFLAGGDERALVAYADLLAVCSLEEAFAHRVRTFPAGRAGQGAYGAWLLEGFRWLGPEVVLGGS